MTQQALYEAALQADAAYHANQASPELHAAAFAAWNAYFATRGPRHYDTECSICRRVHSTAEKHESE